jgi:hypothetical protein
MDFFKEQYPHVEAETWNARMEKGQVMDETRHRVNPETFELVPAFFITASWKMKKLFPLWSRCSMRMSISW